MREIDAMTRKLPSGVVYRLKYETFCDDPRRELRGICDFLGVEFQDGMLSRPRTGMHHIGGSPSKFDASMSAIVLDRSHEDRFTEAELAHLRRLVGDVATKWGY
jgi:hypothetical protein